MSKWHGGKGSDKRPYDMDKFGASYDRIFKKREIKFRLLLDDCRFPRDCFLYNEGKFLKDVSGIQDHEWTIVRSVQEFKDAINTCGIPEVVSFDFDLLRVHYKEYQKACDVGHLDWEKQKDTGAFAALFLKEKCEELGLPIPKYYIHSANHYSHKIIREILK